MERERDGAYVRRPVENAINPITIVEPSRPTGLISAIVVLSVLLIASFAANVVLLMRKPETVPGPIVAVTVTPTTPSSTILNSSPSVTPTSIPTSPTPTEPAIRPEEAAQRLYEARKAGSKASARTVATSKAIEEIFSRPGSNYEFIGCEAENAPGRQRSTCQFEKAGSTLTMELSFDENKWMVQSVRFT